MIARAPDAIWHHHQAQQLSVAIEDPGVVEVVNTMTMTIEQQIPTEPGAHTTAFDAKRQRLYVFSPSCRVAVYEISEVSEPAMLPGSRVLCLSAQAVSRHPKEKIP